MISSSMRVVSEPFVRDGVHVSRSALYLETMQSVLHRRGLCTTKVQIPRETFELLGAEINR